MRAFRIPLTLIGALAIATMLTVTGARADEYTKLTYLTFSGPVQVPGVTLPAGTYMFKLADPESGRRAIQIWDEKGTKLFTTLLTIPDEQPEPKDDPVVLFSERPAGSAAAVKSWFYPAERTGYEFIYPKSQAMRIAADAKTPVMAYNDDLKADADEAAMRGAQIGRVDASGQAAADNNASTATTTTASATTTSGADRDQAAPAATAPAPSSSAPSSTASAPSSTATTTASSSPAPDANRSGAGSSTATATTTTASSAPRTTTADRTAPSAVGTSGQSARPDQPAQTAQRQQELPRTASPLAALQLMSIGLIASGLGVRHLRRRYAANR